MPSPVIIPSNQASGAFRRAEFASFDQPAEPAPTPAPAHAADPDTEAPFEIAPGIPLPTAEDVERIQQEAWKEGYAAGYEEGSARGRMEAAELFQVLQALDESLKQLDQEVAEELQALALEVARQVVRDTLEVKPEAVLNVIREALNQLPQQAATIRVNPQDGELVRTYLGEQYHGVGHRLIEDEDIARGGCLVDAAGSQVDAQITTRWRRVVENLSASAARYEED